MEPQQTRSWAKKKLLVFSLISTFLLTLVLLLGLEGGGRLYIYLRHGVPDKSYGLWRHDNILGAQHRENAYNTTAQTNNYGFRNIENVLDPKPHGALRVIAYGGSTTFCYNLPDEEAWPAQLEKLLRHNHNGKDQVLNAGAIMWSLGHAFARAKKDLPALQPDYVIIYSGINEMANAQQLAREGRSLRELVEKGEYGAFATNLDQNRWEKRNLILVRLLDYVIKPLVAKYMPNQNRAVSNSDLEAENQSFVLKNYLEVLKRFIDLAKANGATPVFVVQAHSGKKSRNELLTSYSWSGAQTAKQDGAIVVNAQDVVDSYEADSRDLFYPSGVHYSKEGAIRLADVIYKSVFSRM